MSNSRNLADLDIGAGGLLPSASMAVGAAVSNIGYTPVNIAGATMTGALTATGFTGPLTGNAATSTALQTGRTIALTGDVTYTSPSFDGTADVTAAATLANTAVTAGSYTFSSITVDSKGRLTAASSGSAPVAFPAGTAMMFVQTAAPTGWTKSTTHDNKALRVVSGTASSGGTTAFSTVFANQTPTITTSGLSAGATTLSTAQMPSHTHTYSMAAASRYVFACAGAAFATNTTQSTGSTGGGGSHTHTVTGSATSSAITLAVQYVDVIIATKD